MSDPEGGGVPSRPRRPTIGDVAAAAGVSTVTVSRVIDESPKVSEATRRRVVETMATIGYFGKREASELVSGRPSTVAVVATNTTDYGYAATIRGIEASARARGMGIMIHVVDGPDPDAVLRCVRAVASRSIAGVIVLDFDAAARSVVDMLPAYLPCVTTGGAQMPERMLTSLVMFDEAAGTTAVTQHLIDLGHSSAFVLAAPETMGRSRRTQGVLDTLARNRMPQFPVFECESWSPSAGAAGAAQVLADYGDRVTALICANDEIAIGAMRAVHDVGLSVPGDVSVVGFDDHPLAAYAVPALTTVTQDFDLLGARAMQELTALFDTTRSRPVEVLEPVFVARESSAPPNPMRGLVRPGLASAKVAARGEVPAEI